ncbi:hypothetical protein FKM82_002620 [Ascaphus truei]
MAPVQLFLCSFRSFSLFLVNVQIIQTQFYFVSVVQMQPNGLRNLASNCYFTCEYITPVPTSSLPVHSLLFTLRLLTCHSKPCANFRLGKLI